MKTVDGLAARWKAVIGAGLLGALGVTALPGAEGTVSLQVYAGLTITGAIGSNYVVQSVGHLARSNDWQNVVFLTLPSSPYLWFDTNAPATGNRFYRVLETPRLAQPNGVTIPSAMTCLSQRPFGLQALLANQCGPSGACEASLWHVLNDDPCIPSQHSGLDAWADASLQPAFLPTGTLTFRVVSRGLSLFRNAFAWYNVTGAKPGPSDLHVMLDCNAATGSTVTLALASEPGYLGGAIGFALLTPDSPATPGTCAGDDCCATVARFAGGQGRCYYSEAQYNPDSSGGAPFLHLLAYQSRVVPNRYYLAGEESFGATKNGFIDLVVAVDGISPGR